MTLLSCPTFFADIYIIDLLHVAITGKLIIMSLRLLAIDCAHHQVFGKHFCG